MVRIEIIQRIWGGIAVFGLCAAFGLRLLYRGIRGDILDASGAPMAGRGWFVAGGIVLVLPLVGYLLFIWRQGYFAD